MRKRKRTMVRMRMRMRKMSKNSMTTKTTSGASTGTTTDQGQGRKHRQQKVGRVSSDKMQKTIVVTVESLKRDRIYKRTYKFTAKFKAHDEQNSARIGDIVRIEETRPLSKDKHWRLVEILQRAVQVKPVEEVVAELEPELEPEPESGDEEREES
jgi:small subunit ribosomal protein S17